MSVTVTQKPSEEPSDNGQAYDLNCDGCEWEDRATDREAYIRAMLHITSLHNGDGGVAKLRQ